VTTTATLGPIAFVLTSAMRGPLLALVLLVAAGAAGAESAPLRVLFVGNSYTYVNNVPALVEAIAARAGGRPIDTEMLVAPGAYLDDFIDAKTVLDRLAREIWDVVVLQELGGHLACLSTAERPRPTECTEAIAAHRKLAKAARARGARVIVFGTWSMTDGVQGLVSRASRKIASQVGGRAVDVGWMLERAKKADATLALFHPDRHLKPTGSVLAALALWKAIEGREPEAAAFHAEVPVWPPETEFSLRRYVSEMPRRLPDPTTLVVDVSADDMRTLIAATRLD